MIFELILGFSPSAYFKVTSTPVRVGWRNGGGLQYIHPQEKSS
jgi:hypothetical protein